MRKVWLTTSSAECSARLKQMVADELERLPKLIAAQKDSRFTIASSAADAEIILFIEPPTHKLLDYVDVLLLNDLIKTYPNKCFVYDWEDEPVGFMPGAYASLERHKVDPARLRASFYINQYNEYCLEYAAKRDAYKPKLVASFVGASSHPSREALLNCKFDDPRILIAKSTGWYDHAELQKRE